MNNTHTLVAIIRGKGLKNLYMFSPNGIKNEKK